MSTFQSRLIELSEEKNLTQDEIAKAISVSQKAVSLWLNGKNQPVVDKIILLANFFQVSIDYLVGREDETAIISNNTSLTTYQNQLLEVTNKLNADQKYQVLGFAKSFIM